MNENSNIFINKKILIYGIGKSGISTFNFLKKYNNVSLFDDNKKIKIKKISNHIIKSHNKIQKSKFDMIILSPGIDANRCKLKNFLKKKFKNYLYRFRCFSFLLFQSMYHHHRHKWQVNNLSIII